MKSSARAIDRKALSMFGSRAEHVEAGNEDDSRPVD